MTVGYTPAGKRIVKKASGRSKTEAKDKLKEIIRDYDDGLAIALVHYTVTDAVKYWLQHGLAGRSATTVKMYTTYADKHVIPAVGARKLRDLSVEDVDRWLASKTGELSPRSLKLIHGILNRSVKSAMRRDKVKRNVVDLCEIPDGREGRTSKALTLAQAGSIIALAEQANPRMRAYVVLSLLIGARTEELRALLWSHVVAFDEERKAWLPVTETGWENEQFAIYVWRSVRQKGDTKTVKSRRSLKLPGDVWRRCGRYGKSRRRPREALRHGGLVFSTLKGTAMSAGNVRRDVRKIIEKAGLRGTDWTPREMRHSFVSLLSDSGVPIEDISRLVGHRNTVVTETVYRKQIRPVLMQGAEAMDDIFGS
ncbi:tyrosine-type recombinase/integrase [Streptosporangium lutulentum]